MSFTDKELELITKIQRLAKQRNLVKKKLTARMVSMHKHTLAAAKSATLVERERHAVIAADLLLQTMRSELTGLLNTSPEIAPKTEIQAAPITHYELGREF